MGESDIANISSKKELFKHFDKNYVNPSHPIAFSGINKLYSYYYPKLSQKEIQYLLSRIESYTLHKQTKKFQRNPYYVHKKREQIQIDLVELGGLSKYNGNINYLFNSIDIFTKFACSEPLKNKTADLTLECFKKTLKTYRSLPSTIVCDQGKEMINKKFLAFCDEKNIRMVHNRNSYHAPHVERFNKTLKTLIYKYLEENETKTFLPVLQDLLDSYNSRIHRIIKLSPIEAEKKINQKLVRKNLYDYFSKYVKKKPNLLIGQKVRIRVDDPKFAKSYDRKFKEEIFEISNVNTMKPIPTYSIMDHKNDELLGNFYESELVVVNNEFYKIEKVLKEKTMKGKKYSLIKWRGYDEPTWEPSSTLNSSNVKTFSA